MATVLTDTIGMVEVLQPTQPPILPDYQGDESYVASVETQIEEITLAKELDREAFIRHHPALAYLSLDLVLTEEDDLYHEAASVPVYSDPVSIPVLIRVDPSKKLLKKYGIEEECDALGFISIGWLEKYQPLLKVKTGDRLRYYDQPYTGVTNQANGLPDNTVTHPAASDMELEIIKENLTDFFGSTQVPLHRVMSLKNVRRP